MVKHLKHELEERAEAVRQKLAADEIERAEMRLRGRTALEHAGMLLSAVEDSLSSEGGGSGAMTERGGFGRRPPPLAAIRPDSAPPPEE